jgi:RecB family exonuclease
MERETKGQIALPDVGGTLSGVADRIDLALDGRSVHLFDYKSGAPPSSKEQEFFDKQLLLEAAIIEQGGIEGFDPVPVSEAAYIGVGSNPKVVPAYDGETPAQALDGLTALIRTYLAPDQHFTARRMLRSDKDSGDYDHLARFGEWDDADPPKPEDLS